MTPLDGLLVADFSRVLAGPLAAMTLADLGATVVKVERPGAGDESRGWGPPWTSSGTSAYYESINRGKYGIAIDLTDPGDRAHAVELARRADVLIENFRPGTLDRYSLDYASVVAANPRVVYCSISGFGRGAGADKSGYDFLVQAVGGLMSVTGEAEGSPVKVGAPVVDVLTAKDAVIGILAALAARERGGVGQHVQVELLSSLLGGLVNQTASYLASGVSPTRRGNVHPSVVPYQTLRCADLPIAVACGNDRQFARLVAALGVPELAADPRFVTNTDRVSHQLELQRLLEDALAHADAATWEQRLGAAGVPAGLVGDVESAIERSRALGLQPLVELGPGEVPQIRHPIGYSVSEVAPAVSPPTVGEDTEQIMAWLASAPDTPLPRVSARRSGGTGH